MMMNRLASSLARGCSGMSATVTRTSLATSSAHVRTTTTSTTSFSATNSVLRSFNSFASESKKGSSSSPSTSTPASTPASAPSTSTPATGARQKVVIMGALGMDFHTFNTCFRNHPEYDVLAFTVAGEQNVGTTGKQERSYPAELAGASLYPKGIPMIPEADMATFVRENKVDQVVFAYSDVKHEELMHKASKALAAGADFRLISERKTMLKAQKPVVAVCAVRTGCGKSQVSRAACRYFKDRGYRVVAIREPMPYGNLLQENVMRFSKYEDFERYNSTIEEREEYEPYIEQGMVIYSGVDYDLIIKEAEKEADVIVWDGGNNEISFYQPDLLFCVTDPLRPGHENKFHPGEVNARTADVFIVNKMNSVKSFTQVDEVVKHLKSMNPKALVVRTNSVVSTTAPIAGKHVLVVEDGPTVTHGDMAYGAAYIAAQKYGAIIVDPKPYLRGSILSAFKAFPHLKMVVPAMGYNDQQLHDLQATLNAAQCDVILNGSPIDMDRLVKTNKPVVHVNYDIEPFDLNPPTLDSIFEQFENQHLKKKAKK